MRRTTVMVGLVLVAALTLIGCSGDDNGDATGDADGAPAPRGEVPDPCALLPLDTVREVTGGDPGPGTVAELVPEQRKVCAFEGGLSFAVEVGENYEATVELIRASPSGATIEDVDGVGSAAIWQDFGEGVGQLVAKGDPYFVGVTVPAGGRDVGEAVARAMLEEL